MRFFIRQLLGLLDDARQTLADFVGADTDGLAFVNNATTGVSTVLRSLDFQPGDELLTTNHDYHACRMALEFVAQRTGAVVKVVDVPLPLSEPGEIVTRIENAVTSKTRLALIDAVSSATATVFPVKNIIDMLHERGVETLIDGAHALAMLDFKLSDWSPTYFTANCHKWLCSPKGAAILWVNEEARSKIHPLAVSYGSEIPIPSRSLYHREFDWCGTGDPTPYLAAARAVEALPKLLGEGGDWSTLRTHNRELALYGRRTLLSALGATPLVPESMVGSIAAVPLPDRAARPTQSYSPADVLYEALLEQKIEVPVFHWPASPRRLLRVSAQIYNRPEQYDRLADFVVNFEQSQ